MPISPIYSRYLYSAKLGEENKRIKAARAVGRALPDKAAVADSDDEGSIVTELTKNNTSCGACRTRESEVWWKAPKGLSTNVLCDNCGISWRKYADLNIRPMREDPVSKGKPSEKREGTPLAQTTTKRPRVSRICAGGLTRYSSAPDVRLSNHATSRSPSNTMLGLSQEWPHRKDPALQAVPVSGASWGVQRQRGSGQRRLVDMRALCE